MKYECTPAQHCNMIGHILLLKQHRKVHTIATMLLDATIRTKEGNGTQYLGRNGKERRYKVRKAFRQKNKFLSDVGWMCPLPMLQYINEFEAQNEE